MKLRSIRGPNWVEASVSVTIMIEKTTPTTVITAPASVVRICRALSAVPNLIHDGRVRWPWYAARSSACVPKYRADRDEHLDRGHEPQVGPQCLAAPLRSQREREHQR